MCDVCTYGQIVLMYINILIFTVLPGADTMVYHKHYEEVQRRSSAALTDRSGAGNYFNASMIIRVPIQPVR